MISTNLEILKATGRPSALNPKTLGKLVEICVQSGAAKVWKSCRSRKTSKNEYLDAKIGVDTAENEPSKDLWTEGGGHDGLAALRAARRAGGPRGGPVGGDLARS